MKNKILFVALLCLATTLSQAQSADTLKPSEKYKKVFPGITLGWNRVGFSTGEAALLIGLANNSLKQTYAMSMIMHGPSFGCQVGEYNNAFRVAPKFSYEYYTSFLAGRVSLVDFLDDDVHSFYVCPEAGISFGTLLNVFAGANFPVSKQTVTDVKTFRLTISANILFFYFAKDKSRKK